MAICGLNIGLDSLQGDITAKISGFISLDDALEAPELLSSYKSTLLAGMATMKANVSTMIPDIPISSSGFTSLRDQMSAYVSLPSVAGLADITSKFGGLTSLTGFANINLSDLASSAFSLGASFDPCALAGDLKIPNITADASGALDALTSEAPNGVEPLIIVPNTVPILLASIVSNVPVPLALILLPVICPDTSAPSTIGKLPAGANCPVTFTAISYSYTVSIKTVKFVIVNKFVDLQT